MKKRPFVWITLCVALLVAGIAVASTQTRTWRGARGVMWFHHGPAGYFAHELDLSANQKSQIKTIWEGERPNVSQLVRELASEQKELNDLSTQDGSPDEARIQEITARQGATLAKLLTEKEKIKGKIYAQVLTPVQRTKADAMLKRLSSHLSHVADRIDGGTTKN